MNYLLVKKISSLKCGDLVGLKFSDRPDLFLIQVVNVKIGEFSVEECLEEIASELSKINYVDLEYVASEKINPRPYFNSYDWKKFSIKLSDDEINSSKRRGRYSQNVSWYLISDHESMR